jgi:hypothetical protein
MVGLGRSSAWRRTAFASPYCSATSFEVRWIEEQIVFILFLLGSLAAAFGFVVLANGIMVRPAKAAES